MKNKLELAKFLHKGYLEECDDNTGISVNDFLAILVKFEEQKEHEESITLRENAQ